MTREEKKQKAICLRIQNGLSVNEIQKQVEIPYSTLVKWLSNYKLSDEQKEKLALRNPNYKNGEIASRIYSETHRKRRIQYQQNGRQEAQKIKLTKENLWLTGCMLYWAEGGKQKNELSFSNSDHYMVILFAEFLRRCLNIKDSEIKIQINCYNDIHTVEEIENFWLESTNLPKSCLHKTMVNKRSKSSSGKKNGVLPYGVCKLRVFDTGKLQTVYGFIKEIGNIEDEEIWLD